MESKLYNSAKIIFLIIYIIAGLCMAYLPDSTVFPIFKNIPFYSYLLISFILGCMGLFAYFLKKSPNLFLWICSIYWLLYSGGELLEINKILPNRILILTMLVVSIACMFFLYVSNKNKADTHTNKSE